MRMWNVNPKLLCRKHLLGAHVETHMLAGSLARGKSLHGFYKKKLVNPNGLLREHNALAKEMTRRGYKHRSQLEMPSEILLPRIDIDPGVSLADLSSRCPECASRISGMAQLGEQDEM